MLQTQAIVTKKRHAWVAVLLTFFLVGLGQIYCGKLTRGLFFACLGVLLLPAIATMLANDVPVDAFMLVCGGIGPLLGITVIAAVDSYRLARRTKPDYVLKEYNRFVVYLLLYVTIKGCALGALLYTRYRLLEAFIVPAPSMCPTIQVGDRVLANKIVYEKIDPQIGDVIIFRNPEHWRQNAIKRVVALEGDTIEMREGHLIINGKELDRQALPLAKTAASVREVGSFREINGDTEYRIVQTDSADGANKDFEALTVPKHHCFVLGDNRNEARDSRDFGPIPLTSIIARADYLYWPAKDWSRFGRLDR